MPGLTSLTGLPAPGSRRAQQETSDDGGGRSGKLSTLSGAPTLGGSKANRSTFDDDDELDNLGPPSSKKKEPPKPFKSTSSASSSRTSMPAPDDDEDESKFPKRRGLVAAKPKGGGLLGRSQDSGMGGSRRDSDSDDDVPAYRKTPAAAPLSSRQPPASTSNYGADDDDDDFLAGMKPPASRQTPMTQSTSVLSSGPMGGAAASRGTSSFSSSPAAKPAVKKPVDTLLGLLKDELPPLPDLGLDDGGGGGGDGLDLFGGGRTSAPRQGRRATGSDAPPAMSASPSLTDRINMSSPSEELHPPRYPRGAPSDDPTESDGLMSGRSTPPRGMMGNRNASTQQLDRDPEPANRSPSPMTRQGGGGGAVAGRRSASPMGSTTSEMAPSMSAPMNNASRFPRPNSDFNDPDVTIGSPASGAAFSTAGLSAPVSELPTPNASTPSPSTSVGTAASRNAASMRVGGAVAALVTNKPKSESKNLAVSWGDDDDDLSLPDDSNAKSTKPPPLPPAAVGRAAQPVTAAAPALGGGSGMMGRPAAAKSPLSQAMDRDSDDDEGGAEDRPSGGYMPSFSRPTPGADAAGGAGRPGGLGTGMLSGNPMGGALGGGGPGGPRPRRQLGGTPAAASDSGLAGRSPLSMASKTKEEEEKERFALAMQTGLARKQAAQGVKAPFKIQDNSPAIRSADLKVVVASPASQPPGAGRMAVSASGRLGGGGPLTNMSTAAAQRSMLDSSGEDDAFFAPAKSQTPAVAATPAARQPEAARSLAAANKPTASPLGRMDAGGHFSVSAPTTTTATTNPAYPLPAVAPSVEVAGQPMTATAGHFVLSAAQPAPATGLPPGVTRVSAIGSSVGADAGLPPGVSRPSGVLPPGVERMGITPVSAAAPAPLALPSGVPSLFEIQQQAGLAPAPLVSSTSQVMSPKTSTKGGADPQELAAARQEAEKLQAALKGEAAKREEELKRASDEQDKVKSERDKLQAQLDALRAERDTYRSQRDSLQSECDHAKKECEAVRGERDTFRAERESLRGQHDVARGERDGLQAERDRLRQHLTEVEAQLRTKESVLHDAEARIILLEAQSKLTLAESQAAAARDAATLRGEAEEMRAGLARVREQYSEAEAQHRQEVNRLRGEVEEVRAAAANDLARLRDEAAQQAMAAETRGRRAAMVDVEIAAAQVKAQLKMVHEEREILARHQLSADLLAQLSEKVRASADTSLEREERAVRVMERDLADRESRVAVRERLLSEREGKVGGRERELDALRSELQTLVVTLDTTAGTDREALRREQQRLAREGTRMEAMHEGLASDKEDLKVQVSIERQLLEEAREARRRERESFINEIADERRGVATEHADMLRRLDTSRAELLALKTRVVDYEARCSAAMTQSQEEEAKLAALRATYQEQMDNLGGARTALVEERKLVEAEAAELVQFAARLQQQSAEMAASHAQFEAERDAFQMQRTEAAMEAAHARAATMQVEEQKRGVAEVKKAFDKERLTIVEERRMLNEERVAVSRLADQARDAKLRLSDAVRAYVAHGIPIPTDLGLEAALPSDLRTPMMDLAPHVSSAATEKRNKQARSHVKSGRSRNTLRHLLDSMGLDPTSLGLNARDLAPLAAARTTGGASGGGTRAQMRELLASLNAGGGGGGGALSMYEQYDIPAALGTKEVKVFTPVAAWPPETGVTAYVVPSPHPTQDAGSPYLGFGSVGRVTVGDTLQPPPQQQQRAVRFSPSSYGVGADSGDQAWASPPVAVSYGPPGQQQQAGQAGRPLPVPVNIYDKPRSLLASSEFPAIVPLSATTSEHDGDAATISSNSRGGSIAGGPPGGDLGDRLNAPHGAPAFSDNGVSPIASVSTSEHRD